jgi:putative NADPH-quinone reductase
MKILILNASPRKNGTISQAVERFAEGASNSFMGDFSEDVRVEVVNVNDLKFSPCRGCMQCRKCGTCCLPQDDAHRVAEKIEACDVLVVAAPVYWGNMPGTLKMLFDRMVYAMMGESEMGIPKPLHKGKDAYIITSCTTPFPFNIFCRQTSGLVAALKEILGTSGFKIRGKVVIPGTKAKKGLPVHAGKCAYRLGFSLAW